MNELVSQNRKVKMINRTGVAKVLGEVEVVKADAHNFDCVMSVCKDATKIYNCASPSYTKWDTEFIPIIKNLESVDAKCKGLKKRQARPNVECQGQLCYT